jgi:signal transduction histidine kinase/DNA-binding response OmpR family regulator
MNEHTRSDEADPARRSVAACPLRVLLIEDSEDDATLTIGELCRGGYTPTWERVDTATATGAALTRRKWDVILADYFQPHFSGLEALRLVQQSGLDLPFIIVSGAIGEDVAVAAMKAGAHDYLMKGNLARLVPAVERELRDAQVREERRRVETEWRKEAQISAALARVASELIALLDTPQILDRVCQLTAEVLEYDSCHTFLWHPADSAYVAVSGYGDTPEQWEATRALKIPLTAAAELLARLAQHDVVQTPIADAPRLGSPVLTTPDGATGGLSIALRRGTEIFGVLSGGYCGPERAFTPQQERIARGVGQLASMALENARLVEELERANSIKGEFVATMSHELRSPLNVIIGYTELLAEGAFGSLAPEQLETLARMDKSARELSELISATLDLSRLETGLLPLEQREVRPRDVLDEIAFETRVVHRKPGVRLDWNCAPDLPLLQTDPLKLKGVLKNIILNAIKFTDQGSVTVDANRRNGGIEISVTDTGIGIAPQVLPIIFEPFRQGDGSTTRRHGGVGLGLYIVRQLLDLLGGAITVDSEVGCGSTFRVWVPTRRENA